MLCVFFFFNDTATTEIYTLSLHDALPILRHGRAALDQRIEDARLIAGHGLDALDPDRTLHRFRSEEHTSELQSQSNLVCRLLLEKKKKYYYSPSYQASYNIASQSSHMHTP